MAQETASPNEEIAYVLALMIATLSQNQHRPNQTERNTIRSHRMGDSYLEYVLHSGLHTSHFQEGKGDLFWGL